MSESQHLDADRRRWLLAGLSTGLPLTFASLPAFAADPQTVRIGYQKSSTLMIFLKSRGILEKALAPLQAAVQWHEFSSGLPLLEALNGRLCAGADHPAACIGGGVAGLAAGLMACSNGFDAEPQVPHRLALEVRDG